MAELQANVLGGRIVPGCVVAEAVVMLLLALAVWVFRRQLG